VIENQKTDLPTVMKRSRPRFTLRVLFIVVAIVALVLAVTRHNRGINGQTITGFGQGGSPHDYPSARDYPSAHDDLTAWLNDRGYRQTKEPPWAEGHSVPQEEWYVDARNVSVYVRVRPSETSLQAYVQFHKQVWPFQGAQREEKEARELASELQKWWQDWKHENGWQ